MTKKGRLKVGFTYDLKSDLILSADDPPDRNAELDNPDTIDALAHALESAGHNVIKIGNINNLLKVIDSLDVDIIFNICEGLSGRNRESQVPMLLELKGIPYVGSDALCLGVTLDKIVAKNIFQAHKIPTPNYIQIKDAVNLNGLHLKFPLIVKPRFEGSSKSLTDDSLVRDRDTLKRQAAFIVKRYKQPALVEEFISGTEFTVAIIGNDNPKALPPIQVVIDGKTELGEMFYKCEYLHTDNVDYICPTKVGEELNEKLKKLAIETYQAVECRDFGRIDMRVDNEQNLYVLEVNPLPSLMKIDTFGVIGDYLGVGYDRLIQDIFDAAVERYGL